MCRLHQQSSGEGGGWLHWCWGSRHGHFIQEHYESQVINKEPKMTKGSTLKLCCLSRGVQDIATLFRSILNEKYEIRNLKCQKDMVTLFLSIVCDKSEDS